MLAFSFTNQNTCDIAFPCTMALGSRVKQNPLCRGRGRYSNRRQAGARISGNFTVHMCGSGSDALADLPEFDPDIILLDVMVPGMVGPDTFKAIRQLDGYASLPIIFMTAKVMEKDRENYRSLDAAGIIAKPFDPMALPDQIREILGQHYDR